MVRFYYDLIRCIERMGPQEWLFAFIGVVLLGLICLRGFGSRSSY
jgi:drug/metabolite transporter (DMT)-like permease